VGGAQAAHPNLHGENFTLSLCFLVSRNKSAFQMFSKYVLCYSAQITDLDVNLLLIYKSHTLLLQELILQQRIFRRVGKIAKIDYWVRHVCPSVRLSSWNNSVLTGRIFVKFEYLSKNCSEN
jgi:hypothetical protein